MVARRLNNWENYETNSAYFDALSIKLYLFQFVNSYAGLFYIAYAKGRVED
jgi:anoctamin-10/anoctamin-7